MENESYESNKAATLLWINNRNEWTIFYHIFLSPIERSEQPYHVRGNVRIGSADELKQINITDGKNNR